MEKPLATRQMAMKTIIPHLNDGDFVMDKIALPKRMASTASTPNRNPRAKKAMATVRQMG